MDAYVSANPDVIASGWDHILINEAGFDDQGTSIQTTMKSRVARIGTRPLARTAAMRLLLAAEAGA